jgi:O-antigen ligase
MSASKADRREDGVPFFALVTFIGLAFLTGGSSRGDVMSLVILLPAAVLCCGVAAWRLRAQHLAAYRGPVLLIAAAIALTGAHLVPLPPALWQALPGRELVVAHDRLLGFSGLWRPISLNPSGTRDVLYGLAVPLAVLLLGIQLGQDRLARLLPIVILLGCLSGVWAIVQFASGLDSIFYTYRVAHPDIATGPFANRNHQALFLAALYPLLGAFAAMSSGDRASGVARGKQLGTLGIAVFLLPLIIAGGSRIGLAAAAGGIVSGALIFLMATLSEQGGGSKGGRKRSIVRAALGLAAVAVVSLLALMLFTARTASFDRLFQASSTQELRFKVWPIITELVGHYFPVGSGIGSFVPVFQVAEPDTILRPTYLNHAHNEALEIALTAGLPGMLLIVISLIAVLAWTRRAFARGSTERLAQSGVAVIMLLVLGSLTDYPLRTPFLSCVLVVASLWAAAPKARVLRGGKKTGKLA